MSVRRAFCAWKVAAAIAVVLATGRACLADILAGDYETGRILRFKDDGTPTTGGIPLNSAGLDGTAGIAVGPDGNIYVSSQNTGEVLFYDGKTGAPLCFNGAPTCAQPGLFTSLVDASHPFSAPGVLRFGPDNKLYVADFGGSDFNVYEPVDGHKIRAAGTNFGPPGGLTFATNGDMYAANFGTSAIIRIHNGTQTPVILSDNGFLEAPASLLFLPNNDLLVVSMFSNRIERYNSNFVHRGTFAIIDPLVPADPEFTNYPSDIVFDADGNLLVSVLGNTYNDVGQVLRYSYDNNTVAGTLLGAVLDAQPPIGSVAWIASADAVRGDFNGNGNVGPDDYAKWKGDFGKWVAKGGGADGNGDGVVNAADYTVWRNAMGGAIGSGTSVPEPTSLALLTIGLFGRLLRARNRSDRSISLS